MAGADRRSRLAANSAEGMAALRAAGAAECDAVLRNPDFMATRFLSARLKVQSLAKVPGVRRSLPAVAERLLPGGYFYEAAPSSTSTRCSYQSSSAVSIRC